MTETVLQVLTPASVRAAARDYHARGMLTAQAPDPAQRLCQIDGDGGRRCAIGAAFNDETMALFRAAGSDARVPTGVRGLRDSGMILVADEHLMGLSDIQRAHDAWANTGAHNIGPASEAAAATADAEARFLALIAD